jgi:hypothetical protein
MVNALACHHGDEGLNSLLWHHGHGLRPTSGLHAYRRSTSGPHA